MLSAAVVNGDMSDCANDINILGEALWVSRPHDDGASPIEASRCAAQLALYRGVRRPSYRDPPRRSANEAATG